MRIGGVDLREQLGLVLHGLRDAVLGAAVGALAGAGSAALLHTLDTATEARLEHPRLVWLLPVVGLVVGVVWHRFGGRAAKGTNLVLDEVHRPDAGVPLGMAPLVLGGTGAAQLVGASVGREGAAVQIAAGLTALLRRVTPRDHHRVLLVAAIAGGFGSVFGVPAAGAVFALEVQESGRQRYEGMIAALSASVVGDRVTTALGIHHGARPTVGAVGLRPGTVLALVVAAVAFGLTALVFVELTHGIRRVVTARMSTAPLRPVLGGVVVLALTGLVGTRDYLGLSLPLIDAAVAGTAVVGAAFAWKLLFTSVSLGTGFPGGEVTPLFCIGACLGSALAGPLGQPRGLLTALGFVAVFAAASNTPLACAVLGVETFGGAAVLPMLLVCLVATQVSGARSIYAGQRVGTLPSGSRHDGPTMGAIDRRRRGDD